MLLSCNSQHSIAIIQKQVILVYPLGPPHMPYFEDNFSDILYRISFFCTLRESVPTMTMAPFLHPRGPSLSIHSLGAQFKVSGESGHLSSLIERTWLMGFIHSDTTAPENDLSDNQVFLYTCLCAHYQGKNQRKGKKRRKLGKKTWKTRGFESILRKEFWGCCKILCEVLLTNA